MQQLWKSTSDEDDLENKLGGRGRCPAAQLGMSAWGKKGKGKGKGENHRWELSNPAGRFMPSKARTAELQWV